MSSGRLGSGLSTDRAGKPPCCKSAWTRATALSVSALTASFTITCNTRWMPPLRSSPRWIRSVNAVFQADRPMPFGMPKIPKTNTRRTATIRRVLRMGVTVGFCAALLSARATRLFSFLLVSRHGSDSALDDLDFDVIRWDAQLDRVLLDRDDGSAHAAGGGDAVSRLQASQHLLPLLLLFLIGAHQHQVKNGDD